MIKKYSVVEANICTFEVLQDGAIMPNINEYPKKRICVIDNKNKVAVDVEFGLKYDYIESTNDKYVRPGTSNIVSNNRRAVIFPVVVNTNLLSQDTKLKIMKIMERFDGNYNFIDGNAYLNNEEYKMLLQNEHADKASTKKAFQKKLTIFRKK